MYNKDILALVMDVDGTLTDGKIYMGANGEVLKAFSVKDGYGIGKILPQYGIDPIIITGRSSAIVEQRARELGIQSLYQGIDDKQACLCAISLERKVSFEQIACIGDDLNDLPMMLLCGIKGCPADAAAEVKAVCDYICTTSGGQGAVREFIEWIISRDITGEDN